MITLSDVNANYEDVFQLDFPKVDSHNIVERIKNCDHWHQYNKRKPLNRREGLSVTSLDGSMEGVPDLDSLLQYGRETNNWHSESDFKTKTPIFDTITELHSQLNYFEEDLGRSHFLRLHSGGFFPPHRDNGFSAPSAVFRVVVPLVDVNSGPFVWMVDGKPINLISGNTYYVNTTKAHSLFSMFDSFYLLVMNVVANEQSVQKLLWKTKIV